MQGTQAGLVLAYHGTSKATAEAVIHSEGRGRLWHSQNDYDWLGKGIYFWENSSRRAEQWAWKHYADQQPVVIGAVIQLGTCFDLLDQHYADIATAAAKELVADYEERGEAIPENSNRGRHDFDCALIEHIRHGDKDRVGGPYDSARAAFIEGEPILGRSAFCHQTHVQIAVFNTNCIKGYFWPPGSSFETSAVSAGDG